MSRFRVEDDTEYIELAEWEQELTFFHTLIKVTSQFKVFNIMFIICVDMCELPMTNEGSTHCGVGREHSCSVRIIRTL